MSPAASPRQRLADEGMPSGWQRHDVSLCRRCIPVRCDPACPGPDGVSVLLISGTGGGKGLVFPKARHVAYL